MDAIHDPAIQPPPPTHQQPPNRPFRMGGFRDAQGAIHYRHEPLPPYTPQAESIELPTYHGHRIPKNPLINQVRDNPNAAAPGRVRDWQKMLCALGLLIGIGIFVGLLMAYQMVWSDTGSDGNLKDPKVDGSFYHRGEWFGEFGWEEQMPGGKLQVRSEDAVRGGLSGMPIMGEDDGEEEGEDDWPRITCSGCPGGVSDPERKKHRWHWWSQKGKVEDGEGPEDHVEPTPIDRPGLTCSSCKGGINDPERKTDDPRESWQDEGGKEDDWR
ncbi:hypothetical protein PRZ48_006996 [Zasmidium cellare]|uniref:Uncharacterized protein n=1 Tax=Zasmidium cellare TaxID=395010 RepID=A0ABR0EI73_ZASCE|nr:hypothetical protein PRZ48_006996 [Zasmidium cellare]